MKYFIGLEDIASNALIQSMRRWGRNFVSYNDIEAYGRAAQGVMCEEHHGTSLVIILSRVDTDRVLALYGDYFVEDTVEGERGIRARDGITEEDLIDKFQGALPLDVFMILGDERAWRVLDPGAACGCAASSA